MSDWLVHLVRLDKVGRHPNADALDLTTVYGQTVVTKRDLYKQGDLAVFLPPDSVLSLDPDSPVVKDSGLAPGHCIEAKRFRGIFSNGMLVPAGVCFSESELAELEPGTHVAERLGITKYQESDEKLSLRGNNERDPGYMSVYTDIEGWPKYRNAGYISPGDEVVITLKLHGCNGRFTMRENRVWVGSHKCVKASEVVNGAERNLWWNLAGRIGLENKLRALAEHLGHDHTVVYGEVYGQVQKGFSYDTDGMTSKFRVFDTFCDGKYNNWKETVKITEFMGLETVPVLYEGPWREDLESLSEGTDPLNSSHVREGFVLKPLVERYGHVGRVIFKKVGEGYRLKKEKHRNK